MNRYAEIIFAGVGGQGLVTIGTLLGEAAALEGLNACLSSTYGTEARGTFTKSDVIISDRQIDFIEATEPDAVLCLAQVAYDRYSSGPDGALLLYDSDAVTPSGGGEGAGIGFSLSAIGAEGAANMAALGVVVAATGAVKEESILEAIKTREASSQPLRKGSDEAFKKGFAAGKALPVAPGKADRV